MTPAERDEWLRDCPTLFHMAERGSWPSIRDHGMLSTTALLHRYGVTGDVREALESRRRDVATLLHDPALGTAMVRDQQPMDDAGLRRCLRDGLVPADWYRMLNGRVFFWLSRRRLDRLLSARLYRGRMHDVIELDSGAVVAAHHDAIMLSAINSGSTRPFPVARGLSTFAGIVDYPYADWRRVRPRGERVVELTVAGAVPDVARFVRRVVRMHGPAEVETIYEAPRSVGPQ